MNTKNLKYNLIDEVYTYTDEKLGIGSLRKIKEKLDMVYNNNYDFNNYLIVNGKGYNINIGKRPYHIIVSLNEKLNLHVTPYCIWMTDDFYNVNVLYKKLKQASSLRDLRIFLNDLYRKNNHPIIPELSEFIFDLYNGRRRKDCLLNRKINIKK